MKQQSKGKGVRPLPTTEQLELFTPLPNAPAVIRESLEALRVYPKTDSKKFSVLQRRIYWYALGQLSSIQSAQKGEYPVISRPITIHIPIREILPPNSNRNPSSTTFYEDLIRTIVENSMVGFRNPSEQTIKLLGREKGTKSVYGAIFINAAYRNGMISVDINPNMVPILCALSAGYVAYDRLAAFSLNSTYSQLLFTLLSSYLDLGVYQVTLEDLRRTLGAETKTYNEYKLFKNRILKAALEEINEKTLLSVSSEEITENRKVIAVRFQISTKANTTRKLERQGALTDFDAAMALPTDMRLELTRDVLQKEFTFTAVQVEEIVRSAIKAEEFVRLYCLLKRNQLTIKTTPTRYFASILLPVKKK